MNVVPTQLPDVFVICPDIFEDQRGFFVETWSARSFANLGMDEKFVQDIYKNCVFGIKIMLNENIESYEIFIDDYKSDRTCYQSMEDEIKQSWEKTKQIMKDVREIALLATSGEDGK